MRELHETAIGFFRKYWSLQGAYGELLREYNELSQVNQENVYCSLQLKTVIRLKDIELAEAQNQIAHLQKRLSLPYNPVGYMRE